MMYCNNSPTNPCNSIASHFLILMYPNDNYYKGYFDFLHVCECDYIFLRDNNPHISLIEITEDNYRKYMTLL